MVAGGGRARGGGKRTPPLSRGTGEGSGAAGGLSAASRTARLRAALLTRWGTMEAFESWARAHAEAHGYVALNAEALDLIENGSIPPLPRINGLAVATGLPFEDVARELGIDFGELPRLRAALGSGFTRVEPASLVYPTRSFRMPAEFAAWADPFKPERLPLLVSRWESDTVDQLTDHMRPHRTTVLLDEPHGPGYPRVPLRALLHVDTSDIVPQTFDRFCLVQHPHGWACCRVTLTDDEVTLHSEDRDYYPSLQFPRDVVTIHGRVVAFSANLAGQPRPDPQPLSVLQARARAWPGPEFWQQSASTADMLRLVWERRGFSYHQRLEEDVNTLHGLTTQLQRPGSGRPRRGASLSAGGLQAHLNPDAASRVTPVLTTLFALAAVFGVEVRDLLRAYGVPVTRAKHQPVPGDAAAATAARLQRLRAHDFGAHLETHGWDLAWLLSLLRWGRADAVYHLGTSNFEMAPLLTANAWVTIDPLQPPPRQGSADAASHAADWARPLYLLRTKGRNGFVCAYCETAADDSLYVIPHPRAARRTPEHLPRRDAAVLGRVTHVATLLA